MAELMADTKQASRQRERYGAFLMYVDDWLSSTAIEIMTAEEERGYLRLLMHAWKSEDCGLPDDPRALAVLSKLGAEWESSGPVVLKQFTLRDGRLFNERLLEEREYQRAYRDGKVKAGHLGALARWGTGEDSEGNGAAMADGMAEGIANGSQTDANPNPNPNKNTIDIWFDAEFWPLFPKKVSKPHALKAARAHIKGEDARAAVIDGLKRQLPGLRKQHADGFCPNPATWINGERWNDSTVAPAVQPTPAPKPWKADW